MSEQPDTHSASVRRRDFLKQAFALAGLSGGAGYAPSLFAANNRQTKGDPYPGLDRGDAEADVRSGTALRVTKLETFLVRPRWLFLKIHTDAGIIGWGEPIVEGRAKTTAQAVDEIAPYLVGKDPRRVVHHWQAIYRHAFYRGGPVLTSALSGVEQALWDIKAKALGVPIYEMLGGPTRDRVRVYAHVGNDPDTLREKKAQGFTAFKTGVRNATQSGIVASPDFIDKAAAAFAGLREAGGPKVQIGIDFHGAISPTTPFGSW